MLGTRFLIGKEQVLSLRRRLGRVSGAERPEVALPQCVFPVGLRLHAILSNKRSDFSLVPRTVSERSER
jgi:hypothetical protein